MLKNFFRRSKQWVTTTSKKKVLIVHPIFLWGGAEQVLLSIIKSINTSCDVYILTGKSLKKMNALLKQRYSFDCGKHQFNEIINGQLFTAFPYFMKNLQQRKVFDIDHCFDLVISSSGSLKSSRTTIEYFHHPKKMSGTRRKRKFTRAKKFIQSLILSNEPKSIGKSIKIANSCWTRDNLEYALREPKALVIYPPVQLVEPPNLDKNENMVVSLSRISPEKYIESTISSFNILNKEHPQLHLNLIGSTNNCDKRYVKYVKNICQSNSNITLMLDVSDTIKKSLLAQATYGLHSMPEEHFGIAIVEMMGLRVIPFVPNGGGQIEIVNNELLIYSTASDLLDKFNQLSKNAVLRDKISQECYTNSNKYTEKVFIKNFSELLFDAINQ